MERDQRVLLIDDDQDASFSAMRALKTRLPHVYFDIASSREKAMQLVRLRNPSVVVLDLELDGRSVESGYSTLREIRTFDPSIRVTILTGHRAPENGIRALSEGAVSFLEKPADIDHLSALIKDGLNQSLLWRQFQLQQQHTIETLLNEQLIGKSAFVKGLQERIEFLATSNHSVLITGDTGTGKGHLARLLHKTGLRRQNKFVVYAPSPDQSTIQGSELFGHVKGAFTDASQDRKGLIAAAAGGTLFLDEIHHLPQSVQVTLLTVLQDRQYRPIGSDDELTADVRLICATNEFPSAAVRAGKIRADFYHRVSDEVVHIPSLRDRREDIPDLALYFVQQYAERENLSVASLSEPAIKKLVNHHWPGNIRQLESRLRVAMLKASCDGRSEIDANDIRLEMPDLLIDGAHQGSLEARIEAYRAKVLRESLELFQGSATAAAKSLRVSRTTFYRLCQKSGINPKEPYAMAS